MSLSRYGAKMRDLRSAWGGRCARCAGTWRLEFAHLRPTGLEGRGRGCAERYYDIRKNADSYVLLCHGCHFRLDGGEELD